MKDRTRFHGLLRMYEVAQDEYRRLSEEHHDAPADTREDRAVLSAMDDYDAAVKKLRRACLRANGLDPKRPVPYAVGVEVDGWLVVVAPNRDDSIEPDHLGRFLPFGQYCSDHTSVVGWEHARKL